MIDNKDGTWTDIAHTGMIPPLPSEPVISVPISVYEKMLAAKISMDMIASTKCQYGYNDAVINAAVDALGLKVPEVADD